MNSIKIVQQFFKKSEAKSEAAWQRSKAKKDGRNISKIEIIPAYEFFKTNGWFKNSPFKKLGMPTPEQFMVIIHFLYESTLVEPQKKIMSIVKNAKSSVKIAAILQVVLLPLAIPFFFSRSLCRTIKLSCTRCIPHQAA